MKTFAFARGSSVLSLKLIGKFKIANQKSGVSTWVLNHSFAGWTNQWDDPD